MNDQRIMREACTIIDIHAMPTSSIHSGPMQAKVCGREAIEAFSQLASQLATLTCRPKSCSPERHIWLAKLTSHESEGHSNPLKMHSDM